MRRLLVAALGILVIDQAVKQLLRAFIVRGSILPIIDHQLYLTSLSNTGSAFGLLQGQNVPLVIISIIAIGALLYWHRKIAPWKSGELLCGIILGGILGNLTDRVFVGAVFDFIKISVWPAFNIADAALTLGVIALLYGNYRNEKERPRKRATTPQ